MKNVCFLFEIFLAVSYIHFVQFEIEYLGAVSENDEYYRNDTNGYEYMVSGTSYNPYQAFDNAIRDLKFKCSLHQEVIEQMRKEFENQLQENNEDLSNEESYYLIFIYYTP